RRGSAVPARSTRVPTPGTTRTSATAEPCWFTPAPEQIRLPGAGVRFRPLRPPASRELPPCHRLHPSPLPAQRSVGGNSLRQRHTALQQRRGERRTRGRGACSRASGGRGRVSGGLEGVSEALT